ncbi:ROK family protein [Erythrobacter sp.]|uniref:ROK family protein n=1 Tax=Erythrobacter sp. TaxID=1042 RepID=UPI00311D5FA9
MNSADDRLVGGIEAGGTKFVLAVGRSPTEIVARHTIPTRTPDATLGEALDWLRHRGNLAALGIASFGPLELDRASPFWGHITNTPKPGWSNCDIVGFFAERLGVPTGFDTDVNGAAIAEARFGAGRGATSLAYITVGTGIGGGLIVDQVPVHGAAHPEMGHIFPRRHPSDLAFGGVCPHHGDCLEGLASGPAIKSRWGASLSELPAGHEAMGIIADYLAQLCHALVATAAVEVVVLGGGVMKTNGLLALVQARAADIAAGYFPGQAKHRIVAPFLGGDAGLAGALCLAQAARGTKD